MDRAIDRLDQFEWLVFTSANGVRHFLDRIEARGRDLRALGHLKLAAIGPATAEALAAFRLRADVVPSSYRSEALAEALVPQVAGRSASPRTVIVSGSQLMEWNSATRGAPPGGVSTPTRAANVCA